MSKVILSLDTDKKDLASFMLKELEGKLSHVKVGHIPISSLGMEFLKPLLAQIPLLLDFKFFDIPNTLEKAIHYYKKSFPTLQGYTFCSHLDDEGIKALVGLNEEVFPVAVLILSSSKVDDKAFVKMAERQVELGVRHFICPPSYVAPMREKFGNEIKLFSPGVRNSQDKSHDHQISSDLSENIKSLKTDYLIIGRPLLESENPKEKIKEYL